MRFDWLGDRMTANGIGDAREARRVVAANRYLRKFHGLRREPMNTVKWLAAAALLTAAIWSPTSARAGMGLEMGFELCGQTVDASPEVCVMLRGVIYDPAADTEYWNHKVATANISVPLLKRCAQEVDAGTYVGPACTDLTAEAPSVQARRAAARAAKNPLP
jgi:hypothetical protein